MHEIEIYTKMPTRLGLTKRGRQERGEKETTTKLLIALFFNYSSSSRMFHVIFSYVARSDLFSDSDLFASFSWPTHIFIYYEIFFEHMSKQKGTGEFI